MSENAATKSRVLVVDDSAVVRKLIQSILKVLDIHVDCCENGEEALTYCEGVLPDLILLDVLMTGMSGVEVCQELRSRYSRDELPIIMVTSLSEMKDLATGLEAGANDYVRKPIDRLELLARVKTQLELRAARRDADLKKSQLEKSLAIQSAVEDLLPEAIIVHQSDGEILRLNRYAVEWSDGYVAKSIRELWMILHSGLLLPFIERFDSKLMVQPDLTIEEELELGGSERTYLQVLSRPVTVGGRSDLRLWVWRDVSKMRRLEKTIAQQRRLDTVELFAHGVAHNVNNILGGIAGATEILQKFVPAEQKAERCMSVLRRSVESGRRLTRKMLWPLPKGQLDQEHVPIADIVQQAVYIQEALNAGRSVDVRINLASPTICLPMPSVALLHVLSNVVSNAAESIRGEGRIEIEGAAEQGETFYRLTVRDTGSGMSPEMVSKVFEPFFTTKNLDERHGISTVGNGLGMWSVYHLLKSAGGEIEVSSAVGIGTEVSMRLPATKEIAEQRSAHAQSQALKIGAN